MTTFTVFVLLFGWGVRPWVWASLLFCLFLGAGLEILLLYRCKRFGRWLFPAILAAVWLAAEVAGGFTFGYIQIIVLYLLAVSVVLLLGTGLGAAGYHIEKRLLAGRR